MSIRGTEAYADVAHLPEIVAKAVSLAQRLGFPSSCRPEQGRLLYALASGAHHSIGETGTGCGVGLAWMVAGRQPGVSVVSVERDEQRAAAAARLFADVPDVKIVCGDWTRINESGPFDLLVLDGGGNGKQSAPANPERLLTTAGTVVIDDFTPLTQWPPLHDGALDEARLGWLQHPALLATEVRVAPNCPRSSEPGARDGLPDRHGPRNGVTMSDRPLTPLRLYNLLLPTPDVGQVGTWPPEGDMPTLHHLVRTATEVEAAGYHGMLAPTGYDNYVDNWVAATMVLARTSRVEVLTAVRPNQVHPAQLAKTCSSIMQLAGPRLQVQRVRRVHPILAHHPRLYPPVDLGEPDVRGSGLDDRAGVALGL